MAERPLLSLPPPTSITPRRIVGGGPQLTRPTRQAQRDRLSPKFARLEAAAATPAELMALRADPASIAPERAIVFEVEGSLDDFYRQAQALGLEYLGDFEDELTPTLEYYRTDDPQATLSGRIYLAMPDVRALEELLSRWQNYKQRRTMPRGQGDWGRLFSRLLDVRPWGPQDRVDEQSLQLWRDELAANPQAPIRLEAELWFHESDARRAMAFQSVSQLVTEAGGQILDHAVIPEIRYDAVLVNVPAAQVAHLVANRNLNLARSDEIMFLRSQTVASCPHSTEAGGSENATMPAQANNSSQVPVVALLDGLPMQNHARLAGRLIVDDPDDLEPSYQVVQRVHGTEMASLILHGDLNASEPALQRPLYVRPILTPTAVGERSPEHRLFVDVVNRAVRRMKEGEAGQPAVAPQVAIINFSIGDMYRPFARMLSPLARLLDYLSDRYKVLFLVSAGNIPDRLRVPAFQTSQQFEDASAEAREIAILEAMNASKSVRTLLSPAEAINVLTIGAAHNGSAFNGTFPANRFDPYTSAALPNVCSAMGLGFKKVVKPELLMDGGRAPVSIVGSGDFLTVQPVQAGINLFGIKVARPSPVGGVNYEDFDWGTSVATALATRAAHRIYDVLTDAAGGSNHADAPPEYMPILLKALLVHTAKWGEKGAMLDGHFPPRGQGAYVARRDDITRLLGYGFPEVDRVLDCATNQATLVGYGSIEPGHGLLYRIPLPPELEGVYAVQSFTATLAWFSPLNMRHQGYRRAALDLSSASDQGFWVTPDRDIQPSDKTTVRGTICHERRSAEQASVFVDDGHILIRVSCRATAGEFTEAVPFALAITFEVGIDTGIDVYEPVRQAVEAQIAAAVMAS